MKIPKGGVAFFDSGIGGLTTLAACLEVLDGEQIYYYGDNAHAPYGNLPIKKIRRYTLRAFKKFCRLQVKAAVIACNTVTAVCVEELRRKFSFPIVGIEPAVNTAAAVGGEVYILATRATCESERLHRLLKRTKQRYPTSELIAIPCDGLAGEIEKKLSSNTCSIERFLPRGTPSAVVLGCTHYIYCKEKIARFYGCDVYDGNDGVAKRLQSLLKAKEWALCPKIVKNRDGRPLSKNSKRFLCKKSMQTPKNQRVSKNKNAIKCSHIFFLGSAKKVNKMFYERTFGFNVEQKNEENR